MIRELLRLLAAFDPDTNVHQLALAVLHGDGCLAALHDALLEEGYDSII